MQGVKVSTWSVRRWSEPLTMRVLHTVIGVVEHLEPVIPLVDDLIGKGATPA